MLEGTELYAELQKAVTEYAKTKGEYQSRHDALAELYKNVENADIDAELTADLVGDYLFTDADFVNNLSAKHRNVFQKIYDEVKYLCKVATAGSKEARQLEKVKKTFEDAFRAETKNTAREGGVKYSIERTKSMSWADQINGVLYNGNNIRRNDTLVVGSLPENLKTDGVGDKPLAIPVRVVTKATSGKDMSHSIKRGKIAKLDVGIQEAPIIAVNPERNALIYVTNIKQGGLPIVVTFDMNATFDGDDVHQATSIHLQTDTMSLLQNLPNNATIYVQKKGELEAVGATNNLRGLAANIKFTEDIISQKSGKSSGNAKISLASDIESRKQAQFEIIKKTNPAPNSYSTWIRSADDVKTLAETLDDSDWSGEGEFNPDLTREDIEKAIESGKITVYGSYPIKNGVFVSPSRMEAESYSGDGKVYEKAVSIDDVAWIDPTQGQLAIVKDEKLSLSNSNDDLGPIGDYNVYGEDVALEGPLPDDFAPIGETPNSQTSVDSENGNVNRVDAEDATALSTESSTESSTDDKPIQTVKDRLEARLGNLTPSLITFVKNKPRGSRAWISASLTFRHSMTARQTRTRRSQTSFFLGS